MAKSYKQVVEDIVNKMNESVQKGFIVKFAKSKGGKISQAWYKSKADAEKALAMLKKDGVNGIISPGTLDDTMGEEAPANAVAHGGVDMNPTGKKAKLNKQKDDVLRRMGAKIKENNDNNNVVLRGVNETLNRLEDKIDEKFGTIKEEIKMVPKKKTLKEKFYNGKKL